MRLSLLLSTIFLVLLYSCNGSLFRGSHYGNRQWVNAGQGYGADEDHRASNMKTVFEKSECTSLPDSLFTSPIVPEENSSSENTITPPPQLSKKTFSPKLLIASEKRIRKKGFFSMAAGAFAGAAVVTGVIAAMFNGFAWGLLLILGGILLAYLGIRLSLSAKKDIDTLSSRSTIAWLNRPATIGFVMNIVVLILCGFVTLFLLMALI
ncbi:MAG: hypothetical protein ACK40M_05275 [Flavobacteriales bacterium]